jgi:general secretion pathway protein A
MFETHFGLRENPFASGHQSRFIYPSREHQEALAHLRYGIENREPFVLITGEVGTGKTTALFEALASLQARVAVALLTNSALTRAELLEEICLRFNVAVPPGISKPQAMAMLERHLLALRGRGERAILLLDEAQNFERELLEEIRLLSNLESGGEKLLQIFLVGQPELEKKLSMPELRQLRQRIAVHYRLRPLSAEETERYIQHRIAVAGGDALRVFPRESCAAVHAATNGIPREINQLCAQALLDAFVEGTPSVEPRHVQAAAEETAFQSVLPASETDPRLPPPAEWPAVASAPLAPPEPRPEPTSAAPAWTPEPSPPLPPTTPTPAEPVESNVDASRWQEWLSSLASDAEESILADEPLAPEAQDAAPTPPTAPEQPAAPGIPAPAAPPAAGAPRFAAESALEPESSPPKGGDWRPPLWTPESERQRQLEQPRGRNTGLLMLTGLAIVVVIVVTAVLLFRFAPWKKADTTTPVAPALTLPGAPAGVTPTPPESAATSPGPRPATSTTAPATQARAVPATPARPASADTLARPATATTPAPTTAAAAAAAQEFSISVGTYLDRSRAESELARITSAGGIAGRIADVPREGVTMYAVVLGAFTDRVSAEKKASELIARGTVDEARILARTVPRP